MDDEMDNLLLNNQNIFQSEEEEEKEKLSDVQQKSEQNQEQGKECFHKSKEDSDKAEICGFKRANDNKNVQVSMKSIEYAQQLYKVFDSDNTIEQDKKDKQQSKTIQPQTKPKTLEQQEDQEFLQILKKHSKTWAKVPMFKPLKKVSKIRFSTSEDEKYQTNQLHANQNLKAKPQKKFKIPKKPEASTPILSTEKTQPPKIQVTIQPIVQTIIENEQKQTHQSPTISQTSNNKFLLQQKKQNPNPNLHSKSSSSLIASMKSQSFQFQSLSSKRKKLSTPQQYYSTPKQKTPHQTPQLSQIDKFTHFLELKDFDLYPFQQKSSSKRKSIPSHLRCQNYEIISKKSYKFYNLQCLCTEKNKNQQTLCRLCYNTQQINLMSLIDIVKEIDKFQYISSEWLEHKLKLISFLLKQQNILCLQNLLFQLDVRQYQQFQLNQREYFKKAVEGDISQASFSAVQVIDIDTQFETVNQNKLTPYYVLYLYDGQFVVQTQSIHSNTKNLNDYTFWKMITQKALTFGDKLLICNSKFEAKQVDPQDSIHHHHNHSKYFTDQIVSKINSMQIRIFYNSTVKLKRVTKLGLQDNLRSNYHPKLQSLMPQCGIIPNISLICLKKYPLYYLEYSTSNKTQSKRILHGKSYQFIMYDEGEIDYDEEDYQYSQEIYSNSCKIKSRTSSKQHSYGNHTPTEIRFCIKAISLQYLKTRNNNNNKEINSFDMNNMCNVTITGGDLYSYQQINVGRAYNFQNVQLQHNFSLNQGGMQNKIIAIFSKTSSSKLNVEQIQFNKKSINLETFINKDNDLDSVIQIIEANEQKLKIQDLNHKSFIDLCIQNQNYLGNILNSLDITLVLYMVESAKLSNNSGNKIISQFYCLDDNLNIIQIELHDPKFFYVPKFLPQKNQCIVIQNLKYIKPHSSKQAHILQTTYNTEFTRKIPFHLHNSRLVKCARLKVREKDPDPDYTKRANQKLDEMERMFGIKVQKYFKRSKK